MLKETRPPKEADSVESMHHHAPSSSPGSRNAARLALVAKMTPLVTGLKDAGTHTQRFQASGRLSKKKHSGKIAGAMYSMSFADTPQAKKLSRHCRMTATMSSIA